jgi:hypothetical protein
LGSPLAQQLANEHARVGDDDHSGSARRRSNRPARSFSLQEIAATLGSGETAGSLACGLGQRLHGD